MDCIFCKIISGDIPAIKVLDEERVIAFMDINPSAKGHLLVVPKNHAENIFEIEKDDLSAVFHAVKRCAMAIKEALNADGATVLQLNGKASDQVIPHLHVHVIPRWNNDGLSISTWEMKPGNMEEVQALADQVKKYMPAY